jgi:dTDP-4-dehydrorhamnose reductase
VTHRDAGKKILLVGDRGQLGSQVLAQSGGANIILASDYQLDLTSPSALKNILDEIQPEVLINCAAYTAVDKAESQQELAFALNAAGPQLLAKWCAANNSHLVHISTDYVFSGLKPLYEVYGEADVTEPVSIYGQSKLLGEQQIKNQDNERYSILRTAWLYGFYGQNFLKTMLRLVLSDPQREYKVVNDQYGSPTSADALARQIQAVVDSEVYGTFHATSHGYCSWYEFACEFLGQLGVEYNFIPCTTAEYPSAAPRPINSLLGNERLSEIDLDFFVHWRDDLTLFVDAYGSRLLEQANAAVNGTL